MAAEISTSLFGDSIDTFQGEYRFLSNFWPATVDYEGFAYPSAEHAYQAAKFEDIEIRTAILFADTPGQAKRLGRSPGMRSNWDDMKLEQMRLIVDSKFLIGRDGALGNKLLLTGNLMLIEGNTWGDTYWGVCHGRGLNNLGRCLMRTRDKLLKLRAAPVLSP